MSHALRRFGKRKTNIPCTRTVTKIIANSMATEVMWSTAKITLVIMSILIRAFVALPVQILQLSSGLGESKVEFLEDSL